MQGQTAVSAFEAQAREPKGSVASWSLREGTEGTDERRGQHGDRSRDEDERDKEDRTVDGGPRKGGRTDRRCWIPRTALGEEEEHSWKSCVGNHSQEADADSSMGAEGHKDLVHSGEDSQGEDKREDSQAEEEDSQTEEEDSRDRARSPMASGNAPREVEPESASERVGTW